MTTVTSPPTTPRRRINWGRLWTVARTDLRQLIEARDFWIPMLLLGSIFFLFLPLMLLLAITSVGDINAVQQLSNALDVLPEAAQNQVPSVLPSGEPVSDAGRTSYTLAVFLLAPIAVIVPLTISTAVGASTIVGERERGTGEFLAHSPADVREIYGGKLLAALVPGYLTTIVGFALYSLIVNVIVGPEVGGWFFPTRQWWVLMFWVVPPFLILTLSIVLRLSARVKSTAAAQQAAGLVTLPLILIAYSQSTGALFGAGKASFLIGFVAWGVAILLLLVNLKAVTRARLLGVADEQ
jgi:ABC-2 type transport system permease protein